MKKGFNNSRIIDQLTDERGNIIQQHLQSIKNINPGVMRFPGGTVARRYSAFLPGYDGNGKLYGGNNVYPLMIELMKELKTEIVLVLSVGKYNTFYWEMDLSPKAIQETKEQNSLLIESFLKADIPIFCVELGNEEYFHVPKGNYRSADFRYNPIQRIIGDPERDRVFRENIDRIYDMYAECYRRNNELVKSFNLPASLPMISDKIPRNKSFIDRVRNIDTKYGTFHHYENNVDSGVWKSNVDEYISTIESASKVPICTEYNFWFGDAGNINLQRAFNQTQTNWLTWFENYCEVNKIPLIMKHRLNGNPLRWDRFTRESQCIPNTWTPYDWV